MNIKDLPENKSSRSTITRNLDWENIFKLFEESNLSLYYFWRLKLENIIKDNVPEWYKVPSLTTVMDRYSRHTTRYLEKNSSTKNTNEVRVVNIEDFQDTTSINKQVCYESKYGVFTFES